MALFKHPLKKPDRGASRHPSARDVADQAARRNGAGRVEPINPDITVTGASLIEWTPAKAAFEVAQANPGLCAVLENAALLFASGQSAPARAVLEQGVQTDHDAKLSPLAWLALFDLQQRAGDRAAFDQFALHFVVQFERSAPPWDDSSKAPVAQRAATGGFIVISGKLSAANANQIDAIRRAIAKNVANARLDLAGVTGFDDAGAHLLAEALAEARRRKFALQLLHAEKVRPALDAAVKKGRDGGEGAWLLSLELLQWQGDHAVFDDRAVEFAVTFELSPPSWEPPAPALAPAPDEPAGGDGAEASSDVECVVWSGVMTGAMTAQLAKLYELAQKRSIIPIDMSRVDRIDFVCAGALLNAIARTEQQRKAVQIMGATPIVRALLLLIGISPRHFVKKAQ